MVERSTERAPSPRPVRAVPDFESFYRSEYRSVVGLACALSGSRIAAEDITQDAFLAAHKEWGRVATGWICQASGSLSPLGGANRPEADWWGILRCRI